MRRTGQDRPGPGDVLHVDVRGGAAGAGRWGSSCAASKPRQGPAHVHTQPRLFLRLSVYVRTMRLCNASDRSGCAGCARNVVYIQLENTLIQMLLIWCVAVLYNLCKC